MCPNYSYKVTICGDGAVGKTTLILKYTEKRFRENYIPTIGVQWTVKEVEDQGNRTILTLWDIAGQEIFKSRRPDFYEGSDAVIIVFDVTSLISFDHVENWYQEVQQFCGNIPYILLGNKIDLVEERKVFSEIVESFTQKYNIPYFETSAKTGENVIEIFHATIEKIRQFQPSEIDLSLKSAEPVVETKIDLYETLRILEELIGKNEQMYLINQEFRTITDELFKKNPYHEKLQDLSRWRLEKLLAYRDDAKLSSSDKQAFLEKIQEWKAALLA